MKEFLRREYGPFTGGVWLVVIVGGVGLGLAMRRYLGGRGDADAAPDAAPVPMDYGTDTNSPAYVGGGGTTYNQGAIVSDVLTAIKSQTPPPATTNPTLESQLAENRMRRAAADAEREELIAYKKKYPAHAARTDAQLDQLWTLRNQLDIEARVLQEKMNRGEE